MPTLNWIGKEAVERHHLEIPYRLLEYDDELSVGDKEAGNLLIQGDNLHALKALLPYYAGKVKCIYIDPPYNTGEEKWRYNDNVNAPEIKKWINEVVGKDDDDLTRHDKWLCMMYSRLQLLKKLLKPEGIIFISIDDNEYHNLKQLMDEIFLPNNFITNIIVKMSHLSGVKMSHVNKKLPKLKEYVLMYAKNKLKMRMNPAYAVADWQKAFDRYKSFLIVDDNDEDDFSKWRVITLKEAMKLYKVNTENSEEIDQFYLSNAHKIFRTARNRSEQFLDLPRDNNFRLITTATGLKKYAYKREEVLFASFKLKNTGAGTDNKPVEPLGDIWTDIGINNLHNEGGVDFRNGKKPLKLLKRLIEMGSNDGDIVLDSFAGSGSTGHAVAEIKGENNVIRKYILVELEEDIAKNVTVERLKRVINGYEVKKQNGITEKVEGLGGGFRYCKLGEPLFDQYGNVREGVTFKQLAYHVFFSETGAPLKENAKLDTPLIGKYKGVAYYLLFNGILGDKTANGGNVLTSKVLESLPKYKGDKIIFGIASRLSTARLKKENIVFKQIPVEIKTS